MYLLCLSSGSTMSSFPGKMHKLPLTELEGTFDVCFYSHVSHVLNLPCYVWLIGLEDGVVTWTRRLTIVVKEFNAFATTKSIAFSNAVGT